METTQTNPRGPTTTDAPKEAGKSAQAPGAASPAGEIGGTQELADEVANREVPAEGPRPSGRATSDDEE